MSPNKYLKQLLFHPENLEPFCRVVQEVQANLVNMKVEKLPEATHFITSISYSFAHNLRFRQVLQHP